MMSEIDDFMNGSLLEAWPSLPLAEWEDTKTTLHMWTQIVGKIRLALAPQGNHWWETPLYVTTRGLTTSPMPYGARALQIDFDFVGHRLVVQCNDGGRQIIPLIPMSVADFYQQTMAAIRALEMEVTIWTTPVEVQDRTPFEADIHHAAYDAEYTHRFWQALLHADRVLKTFRSEFLGKASPVHFFWGGFDLAVTRFSGRPAPAHPGVPNVARYVMVEAYSHEVSSCGWWPGGGLINEPMFYAYAYPEPLGFRGYPIAPEAAYFSNELGEFLLPYEAVRTAANPDQTLLAFLQSTYEAAAETANWDRATLERGPIPNAAG
jgi:hypothetical protein